MSEKGHLKSQFQFEIAFIPKAKKYSKIFHRSKHRFLFDLVYENFWTLHITFDWCFFESKYIEVVVA